MGGSRRGAFSNVDFLDLGSREAVDKALSRLVTEGRLARAARGVYVRPGPQADLRAVLSAISRSSGNAIVPAGITAARALGLTTAEPDADVHLTAGPAREITLGPRRIRLRHAGKRELALPRGRAGDALRAILWLGPEMADAEAASRLRRRLSPTELRSLAAHARKLPDWVRRVVDEAAATEAAQPASEPSSLRRKARLVDAAIRPTRARPAYDVPRFWSNRSLEDPARLVALAVERPTVPDLARSILAYGAAPHVDALERMAADGELSPVRARSAAAALDAALKGVDDARRQLAAG